MLIRVIDLETTAFTPEEGAICEIGFCDLSTIMQDPSGAPTDWQVKGGMGILVNPGRPIPPETSAIHHIVDEDVAQADDWTLAREYALGEDATELVAFAAHSAKFERLWIPDEFTHGLHWICTYKCALRLWPDAPAHSNQALRYWRKPEGLDRSVASVAHRAYPDAYVTAFLLREMLKEASVEQLIEWSSQPALQVRCHIGAWRGKRWTEVDDGFLHWVAARDFDEDVLFTVHHELKRRAEADLHNHDDDEEAA